MADHLLDVSKYNRLVGDVTIIILTCPDCDYRFNGRIRPSLAADALIDSARRSHQTQASAEPPSTRDSEWPWYCGVCGAKVLLGQPCGACGAQVAASSPRTATP